jgi:hypothetical protein
MVDLGAYHLILGFQNYSTVLCSLDRQGLSGAGKGLLGAFARQDNDAIADG